MGGLGASTMGGDSPAAENTFSIRFADFECRCAMGVARFWLAFGVGVAVECPQVNPVTLLFFFVTAASRVFLACSL